MASATVARCSVPNPKPLGAERGTIPIRFSSPDGVVEWACRATSATEHARRPMAHNRIRNSNVSLGSSACHILRSLSAHLHVAEAIA